MKRESTVKDFGRRLAELRRSAGLIHKSRLGKRSESQTGLFITTKEKRTIRQRIL